MKNLVSEMKREGKHWEKMFANHLFNEELLSKVYKECSNLNVKNKRVKTIKRVHLKSNLSYDPEIAFLDVYHRKMFIQKAVHECLWMFYS